MLEDPKTYRFLTCGGLAVPGVDDALEFRNTASAMSIMGLSPDDLSGMYLYIKCTTTIKEFTMFFFVFFSSCKARI